MPFVLVYQNTGIVDGVETFYFHHRENAKRFAVRHFDDEKTTLAVHHQTPIEEIMSIKIKWTEEAHGLCMETIFFRYDIVEFNFMDTK